jgi:single-strand DNA-binding protein
MFNEAHISFTGYVAKQPEAKTVTVGGVDVPSLRMRVGWTERRFDRALGEWVDGATSYVTVNCWRKLAKNAGVCIRKGDPVLVKGKLSVRTYAGKDGVARNTVEVEASSVGHDLTLGVSGFQRVRPQTGMSATEFAALQASAADAGASEQNGANGQARFAADGAIAAGLGSPGAPEEPDEPFFDDAVIAHVVDVDDEADESDEPGGPAEQGDQAEQVGPASPPDPPRPARGRRGRPSAAAEADAAAAASQADQVAVPF